MFAHYNSDKWSDSTASAEIPHQEHLVGLLYGKLTYGNHHDRLPYLVAVATRGIRTISNQCINDSNHFRIQNHLINDQVVKFLAPSELFTFASESSRREVAVQVPLTSAAI